MPARSRTHPDLWILFATIFGFLAVAFGAFGAHALKAYLDDRALEIYRTGIQYQIFHTLALLGLGIWGRHYPEMRTALVGWAFTVGILIFSGSLYLLAITDLKFLGAITPIGGLCFLVGWLLWALMASRVVRRDL